MQPASFSRQLLIHRQLLVSSTLASRAASTLCLSSAVGMQKLFNKVFSKGGSSAAAGSDASAAASSSSVAAASSSSASVAPASSSSSFSSSSSIGYPSLLPGSLCVPPSIDPFWFDAVDPTQLWEQHLSKILPARVVQPMQLGDGASPLPPKPANHMRFLCVSDTHNFHSLLPGLPPRAEDQIDALIHAGDWSNVGEQEDVDAFTEWIRALPVKYKIVIAGNHDISFDEAAYKDRLARRFGHKKLVDARAAKAALVAGYSPIAPSTQQNPFPPFAEGGGVAYLEDSGINVEGINVWGSPWQPEFFDWGFNLPTGAPLRARWDLIPSRTQVLVTHGPPLGHGDLCLPARNRAGCTDLLMQISTRIKPFAHVFGHIHEGYGQTTDGVTQFVNASNCNIHYDARKLNRPIVIDVPNPNVHTSAQQSQDQGAAAANDAAASAASSSTSTP